ncbi:MAG: hypothetical protein ABS81_00045 [Pseudonocardia sp. SCN 72-86]|nr:MAG: hypothetical protein ABS81_00045 [Pseudonocardia sp. SCN 72-86]
MKKGFPVTEGVHDSPARIGRRTADEPIAIVGMAGLFPMAKNYRDYWQNILDAVDCTTEVPPTHWRPEDHFDPEPSTDPADPDTTYCTRGGFVPPTEFAPGEFGLPPNQLEVTTTVQLLSLVVARDLLRDAGAVTDDGDASWYDPARTGITLGVTGPMPLTHPMAARLETPVLKEVVRSCGLSDADAEAIARKYLLAFPPWEENTFPGLLGNVAAGRIANRFDLGGINCAVDAACASSLSALRLAVSELNEGRADLMITGGCDTENTVFGFMCFSRTQALSKSGRIKPFDDTADGTLVGEGIGMLALKRLADARRDGDRIHAIIRGVGSSSDGRFGSIYAPRASGQVLALQRAYTDAGCSPSSVELFEGHATGTAVGDRTELTALGTVLSDAGDDVGYAAIGSVKSQIGHTKGAAGTASLMKLALALRHKVLPPTINIDTPNSALVETPGALYPNTVTRPWIRDPRRPVRRAAASAMGFGGTNFHVVLEEAEGRRVPTAQRGPRAHVFHAADPVALLGVLRSTDPAADGPVPADHARVGFVARSADDAAALRALAADTLAASGEDSWEHPRGIHYRRAARPDLSVAALFAGQGSQYVDMGRTAAVDVPAVGAAFDAANDGFADAGADTLAAAVFPPPAFGTDTDIGARREAALRRTDYAQPAIGALAAGQFTALRELGLVCDAHLGHSFGELVALWAAGSITDEQLHHLARARGRAMATAPHDAWEPGAMAAVSASRDTVEEVLAAYAGVVVCNHNAPDQVVVGGPREAVAVAVAAFTGRGITARELPVAAAFHTENVAHAVDAFRAVLDDVDIRRPAARLVANTAGAEYTDDVAANRDVLAGQLRRPVEFATGLTTLADAGVTVFVEFGPRQVLTGLVRRTLADRDVVAIATDAGPGGDSAAALLDAATQLRVLGVALDRLDGWAAEPFAEVVPSGMTITISGITHRPAARDAAYAEALADGYRVELPAAPVVVAPPAPPAPLPPVPAPPVPAVAATPVPVAAAASHVPVDAGDVLADHLDLHARYLDGQLRIAEGLVEVVRDHGGTADEALRGGIWAVADTALAISRGHTHANEVLARLSTLGGPVRPMADPAEPVPVAVPVPVPVRDMPLALAPASGNGVATPLPPAPVPVAPAASVEPTPAEADADVVRAALRAVVAEKTGYPVEMVEPGMDLETDLGIDSIKRVQILGALAEKVPGLPAVGPEQLAELRSVDDIVGVLARVAAPAESPVTAGADAAAVRAALLQVVSEKTGYPVEMVEPRMDLETDLGIDSIKRVQILGAVAERIPGLPPVGPEQLAELRSVDDIVGVLAPGGTPAPAQAVDAPGPRRRLLTTRPLPPVDRLVAPYADAPVALVVECGASAPDALDAALTARGWTVHRGTPADGTDRVDACIVVAGTAAPAETVLGDAVLTTGAVLDTLRRTASAGSRATFLTVTRIDGALGRSGTAAVDDAALGGLTGLAKTVAREAPELFARAVDIAPGLDDAALADVIVTEMHDGDLVAEVGIDDDRARHTLALADDGPAGTATDAQPTVGTDDVVLVTGGARGVTAACVVALAGRVPAGFLLLGRTPVDDTEPRWAAGVDDDGLRAAALDGMRAAGETAAPREVEARVAAVRAAREVRGTLDAVRAAGARVRYLTADVTDADAVRAALGDDAGRVTVVVHGAGALADAALPAKTADAVAHVLRPKVAGLRAVLGAVAPATPRVVAFGSIAGVLGNPGQADYATANEAVDRVVTSLGGTTVHWGAWDGGMVTPELKALFTARGVALLDVPTGAAAFVEELAADRRSVLVAPGGPLAPVDPAPVGEVVVRRETLPLTRDAVVGDHRIGAHPVLPLSAAMGWMARAAERAHRDLTVVGLTDVGVHRGLVLDGAEPAELELRLGAGTRTGAVVEVPASIRATGAAQPLFSARLTLAAAPGGSRPGTPFASDAEPGDGLAVYRAAELFHGPRLQGLRRVLRRGPGRLVAECALPDTPLAGGGWASALHSPVLGDVVLQVAAVLGVWHLDAGCLPLSVGAVELLAPLPADAPFVVVADDLRPVVGGVTVSATVHDADGTLLQRWTDVGTVTTPDMSAKFREAVDLWDRAGRDGDA